MLQEPSKVRRNVAARLGDYARRGGSLATVVLLVFVGFWGGHWLSPQAHREEESRETAATPPLAREVALTPEKIAAAGIATMTAEVRELRETATVPGRLGYDRLRHVEVKVPVASVVETVLVRPGEDVEAGQPLVELSSSEVAVARNELLQAAAEVKLVQTRYAWQQVIHRNIADLIAALEKGEPFESIEAEFAKRTLGEQRQALMSAYSELKLAQQVVAQSRRLKEEGALSGRLLQERISRRERAAAAFRAVLDQVQYDTRQKLAIVEAELQVARRRHDAKQERLKLLMGPFGSQETGDEHSLSHYRIHAPFPGRVADLSCSAALRVARGEMLMVIADDRQLWLSARIHQRQWAAVDLKQGEVVKFRMPAFPQREWEASVSFIGTEVAADGHFLPLVATVDNKDRRLRPGMFAWVDVPLSVGTRALAIPESAVQRHDGRTFVFKQIGPGRYQRVDVKLGAGAGGWVAVESGLSEGDVIVSHGAFFLKSELLLEREEA